MIAYYPEKGPDEANLSAIELRRADDPDIAELCAIVRRMRDGHDFRAEVRTLEQRVRELEYERDDAVGEVDCLRQENNQLKRQGCAS